MRLAVRLVAVLAALAAVFPGGGEAATKIFTSADVGNSTGQAITGYYGQRKLVRDADGYWYAVVGGLNAGKYEVVMKKSTDTAGTAWSSKTVLCGSGGIVYDSTSYDFRFPSIDIDRKNGKIHLVFQLDNDILYYSKLVNLSTWTSAANWKNLEETAAGYEQLVSVANAFYDTSSLPRFGHTIAVDGSGNPHVAYSRKPSGSSYYKPYYLYGSTSAGWNGEVNLSSGNVDHKFPTVEVDSNGRVHYLVQYDTQAIYSYYSDNYTSFTVPSTLFSSASYTLFGITMAADGNGKVHAATRESISSNDTDTWTAYYDGSSWTATEDMDTRTTGWIDIGARQGAGLTNHVLLGTYLITSGSYPQRLYSWAWTGSDWGQPETDTGFDQDYGHSMEKNAPAGSTDIGYLWYDDEGDGVNADCVWFDRVTNLGRPPLVAYSEYNSSNDDIVRVRSFDGADWGSESDAYDTNDSGALKWHVAATSPDRSRQAVVAVGSGGNTLYAALYDGSSWTTASLGTVATSDYRCFSAVYEQQSGHLLIVAGTTTNNQIKYWVHDGSSWVVNGSTYTFTNELYNTFTYVRMDARPDSNQIALIGLTSAPHCAALIWDGEANSWGNEKKLSSTGSPTAGNLCLVDVKHMRAGPYKGQAVVVWGSNSTLYSWTWTGGAWEASAKSKSSAAGGSILWVELAADPNSSKLLAALGDGNEDLYTVDWSGSSWGTAQAVSTDLLATVWYGRRYAVSFESGTGHTSHAVIAYSDSANLKYRHTSDITGVWGAETNIDASYDCNWVELALDFDNTIHLVCQEEDGPDDLIAYSWNNSVWTSEGILETDLQYDGNGTYEAFAVTTYPPAQVLGVTAVRLLSFSAQGEGAAVRLAWETAQEVRNKGFDVYRADSPYGEYVKLNQGLIPSVSVAGEGKSYSFLDSGAVRGRLYYYKLEDVDATGTHTPHGPICVDWDADGLPDDWEIANGLDPTVNDAGADADGDGVANGLEYRRGTDPRNRDTDGDGVPDGDERKEQTGHSAAGGLGALRGVTVIAADSAGQTLELETPGFETTVVNEGAEAFERLRVASYVHGYSGEPGRPQLPVKGLLIDVPEGKQAKLTVLSVSEERLSGYRLYPAPVHAPAGDELLEVFTWDEPAYGRGSFEPSKTAELSIAYLYGGGVKQRLLFYPFAFNAASGELLQRRLIRVRIDFVAETAGQAALTRTAAAAVASAWPPPAGAAAWKIATAAEGIHRVTRDWLTAQGIGPTEIDAIDLAQVRLFHLGAEQAIEVTDVNGNGRLEAGDHIGFYAAPVPGAYRKYTRENLYWLVNGGGAGALRMQPTAGAPGGGVLAASHEYTLRHELDQLYLPSAPGADALDRWIFSAASIAWGPGWGDPQAGLPKSLSFSLPGALGAGELTVRLYSPYDPAHTVTVAINGVEAGTAAWSGIGFGEAAFTGVAFTVGVNTVSILCTGATDKAGVDFIEARYARDFAAASDVLKFSHVGGYRYELAGFTSADIALYDITDPASVSRVTGGTVSGAGPYSLEVEPATAVGTRTYLAVGTSTIPTPAAAVADTASSLSEPAEGADWILITSRALGWDEAGGPQGWVEDLLSLRRGQGLRCAVVDVADVFDEFGYGFAAPAAIRAFLAHAYANWPAPAPRYVLLVGDATYDFKNNWGLSPAPVNHVPVWLISTTYAGETVTDERYVQFDADGGLARMAIGRLPAATLAQAEAMAAKIVAYETAPNTKSWQRRVVLAADNLLEEWESVFESMGEDAAALLPAGMDLPQRFYLKEYEDEALSVTDLTAELIAAINAGALIVHYSGHAGLNLWATERILDNRGGAFRSDVDTLVNGPMTPFVVNMACLSGYFIYPFAGPIYQSLAEGFMRAPGAGAVAALMPTAMTATDGQQVLSNALYEALFAEDKRVLGVALAAAREALLANGGDAYQQSADTFMLFGDPATVLKVPLPRRPAGLAAEWQNGQALLTWSAALDCDGAPVAGYHLYRRAAGESDFTRLTDTPVNALTYTDAGLAAGITYTYAVSAVDADGDESVLSATAAVSFAEVGVDPDPEGTPGTGGGGGCFVSAADQAGGFKPMGLRLFAAALGLIVALHLLEWRRRYHRLRA